MHGQDSRDLHIPEVLLHSAFATTQPVCHLAGREPSLDETSDLFSLEVNFVLFWAGHGQVFTGFERVRDRLGHLDLAGAAGTAQPFDSDREQVGDVGGEVGFRRGNS